MDFSFSQCDKLPTLLSPLLIVINEEARRRYQVIDEEKAIYNCKDRRRFISHFRSFHQLQSPISPFAFLRQ